jgi:predicted dehydrogenase
MEAFLELLSRGDVRVESLAELRLPVERAEEAYAQISGERPPLAALLTYEGRPPVRPEIVRATGAGGQAKGALTVALVGAGAFVQGVHLPNLSSATGVTVKTVVTRRGSTAGDVARRLGGAETSTDWRAATDDPEVDLVVIGTRHDTHAEIAAAALRSGKAVLLEKPLGLTRQEIDDVWEAARENPRFAIGFNRPYAPLAARLGEEVRAAGGPLQLIYRVNSPLPREHWLNDPVEGGGRVLGEACHMYDFANWLCGVPLRVQASALPAPSGLTAPESTSVTIEYTNGSVASVHYLCVGPASLPKERVEVLRGGQAWMLDDFTVLTSYGQDGEHTERTSRLDKGHTALLERVLTASRGGGPFEPGIEAAYAAQSVALAALEALATGSAVNVALPGSQA